AGCSGHWHGLPELDYGQWLDLHGADFQMEAADPDVGEQKQKEQLPEIYRRLHQRYEPGRKLLKAPPGAVAPQVSGLPVAQMREEQQKLREAMVDLERRRLDNWKATVTQGTGRKPK